MRLTSYINNQKCLEWGLNLQQGALFDLLNQLSGWAEPIYIDGAVYYWVAKSKICEEIPVAYSKPDTAYRALKVLEEKGLIIYIKFGSKDCVSLTEKGKEWNSEINPSVGNKSEQTRKNIRETSEKNPTYKTTKDNSTIDNKNTCEPSDQFELWYSKYPRQVNKKKAWQAWKRLKLDPIADQLIEKLEMQNAMQYAFTAESYIPHPTSYLNAEAWTNPIEHKFPTGGNHAPTQPTGKQSLIERVSGNCQQAESNFGSPYGASENDSVPLLVKDDGAMD